MFRQVFLVLASFLVVGAKSWSLTRNPFEMPPVQLPAPPTPVVHPITECMHVASEAGLYTYGKKAARNAGAAAASDETPVCGLYVVGAPDTVVEIAVKYMHVSCDAGGLMAFVDGWELNGEFFPSLADHQLPLEQRVSEFCSPTSAGDDGTDSNVHRLFGLATNKVAEPSSSFAPNRKLRTHRRTFRSSQNAALLQYRIPVRGSFIVSVRFLENRQPCHILTEGGAAPAYMLRNHIGAPGNCTLTALYPAVVEIAALSVGTVKTDLSFDCDRHADRVDIGGSAGLDSSAMQVASTVCGRAALTVAPNKEQPPANEQAIFCGVTTVRLVSSGRGANEAMVAVRPAGESDVELATLMCGL